MQSSKDLIQDIKLSQKLLKETVFELENVIIESPIAIEKELRFTQRLKKYPNEYNESVTWNTWKIVREG